MVAQTQGPSANYMTLPWGAKTLAATFWPWPHGPALSSVPNRWAVHAPETYVCCAYTALRLPQQNQPACESTYLDRYSRVKANGDRPGAQQESKIASKLR